MVEVTASVEHHAGDALLFRSIGYQLPDQLGSVDVSTFAPHLFFGRASRDQRMALTVIDHLGIDVLDTPEHGQPGARFASRHAAADSFVNAKPNLVLRIFGHYLAPAPVLPAFLRSTSPV